MIIKTQNPGIYQTLVAQLDKVRPQIQGEDSTRPMTHHGMRHSFAARMYKEAIDNDRSPLSANLCASQLLGHERPDVPKATWHL